MISRNTIRIKVMQSLYTYFLGTEKDIKSCEKKLLTTFEDMYRLYIKLLALFAALTYIAEQVIETKKKLFFAKEEDLNPNRKFIDNQFIEKINKNESLQKAIQQYGVGWENDVEMVYVRKIYNTLTNTTAYIRYMQDNEQSFDKDKEFILNLIGDFLLENEDIILYLGEIKLNWQVDYNDVIIMVYNTLKSFNNKQSDTVSLPPLFKITDNEAVSEDKTFMSDLFYKTIKHNDYYEELITKKLQNWEVDRIATMDFILLKMAICEFCSFPNIPIRVTLNEYIEISKYYSTPKSRIFINGLLDKILDDLKAENKINKQGREV